MFYLIAFISEIIGTVGGFGSSTFFVPLALIFKPVQEVLILTSFLHVVSNAAKMILFRHAFSFKQIWPLAYPSILAAIVGALLTQSLSLASFSQLIGFLLLVLLVLQIYLARRGTPPLSKTLVISLTAGSGFLTGLLGTGGALRALALSTLQLKKDQFIVTSASIDFLGDVSRLIIYLQTYDIHQLHFGSLLALIFIAAVGSYLGKIILTRISEKSFQVIVQIMVAAVALFTLIRSYL